MADQGCLAPFRRSDGAWSKKLAGAGQLLEGLRQILRDEGHSAAELAGLGLHSCKHILLSWASKYDLARETRRILGYHAKLGKESVHDNSRDEMAGPLDELWAVIEGVTCD